MTKQKKKELNPFPNLRIADVAFLFLAMYFLCIFTLLKGIHTGGNFFNGLLLIWILFRMRKG